MSEENQSIENTISDAPVVSKGKKGKGPVWVVIVLVALVGAYFVLNHYGLVDVNSLIGDKKTASDSGAVDAGAVVATVNGIKITRGELDEKIEQVRRSLPAGTPDPTQDAAFELQLLEDLINLKLLTMAAEEMNYTVSDDEVAAERSTLVEQFGGEETFSQQLSMLGITEEALKENMRNELLIRQLLDDKTDIESVEVTDEEIKTAYDMAVGETEDAPPLEQVEELIRSQLLNQKTAEVVQAYIDELRASAQIEKTL